MQKFSGLASQIKISDKGVYLKDGRILEADTVIISVGDRPDFSFLEKDYLNEKGFVSVNEFMQTVKNPKVFVPVMPSSWDYLQMRLLTEEMLQST